MFLYGLKGHIYKFIVKMVDTFLWTKLFNMNFHPLQVRENYSDLLEVVDRVLPGVR